jgi:hypothetical protein
MDQVPNYLVSLIILSEQIATSLLEGDSVDQQVGRLSELSYGLDRWVADDEFWNALDEEYPRAREMVRNRILTESYVEQEIDILTSHVYEDRQRATGIAIEVMGARAGTPQKARANVEATAARIQILVVQIPATPERSKVTRKRQVWKVARKVLRYAGGGLAIAADIVIPDPTLLLRAASIVGGVSSMVGG